ncbi:Ceramide synthase LOH2 [Linum perenne]
MDAVGIWSRDIGSPEPWHSVVAVCFAFCLCGARFLLDKFIFRGLTIWLLGKRAASPKIDEVTKATIVKCSESMWKLTYYATLEVYILKILNEEPWFWDTKLYFKGLPNQELKLSIMLYYMCECGFYLYSIPALVLWETRRKDFAVMMSHHIITVALIGISYVTRMSDCTLSSFFRIGTVILALHDASDVFLEAAKICNKTRRELGASIFFGLFAASWLILRLIFFPFWVIHSTSHDLVEYLDLRRLYQRSLYYGFNTMLFTLLIFHIYWWILIWAMIKRQLLNSGKVEGDIRSDSEEED